MCIRDSIKAVRKSDVLNDYEVCRYIQLENGLYADVYSLEIAQKLYEKKLITYPRTGSRYIPEDVFAEIPKLLAFIGSQIGRASCRERVFRAV